MYDDKLICSAHTIGPVQRFLVLLFFKFYARCKGLLNLFRSRSGRNNCEGWCDARAAIEEQRPEKMLCGRAYHPFLIKLRVVFLWRIGNLGPLFGVAILVS